MTDGHTTHTLQYFVSRIGCIIGIFKDFFPFPRILFPVAKKCSNVLCPYTLQCMLLVNDCMYDVSRPRLKAASDFQCHVKNFDFDLNQSTQVKVSFYDLFTFWKWLIFLSVSLLLLQNRSSLFCVQFLRIVWVKCK